MKAIVLFSAFVFSMTAMAASYKFPTPKTAGVNSRKVIFVSSKRTRTQGPGRAAYFKQKAILQWGTAVYEAGYIVYACYPQQTRCEVDSFQSQGSYGKCAVTAHGARCTQPLEASGNASPSSYFPDRGNGPAYEEQIQNEASSSSAFEERGDHHLDQARPESNQLDTEWTAAH